MAGLVVENRIFVGSVPLEATKDDLAAHFNQFGVTSDVYLPLQYGTSQHKGICYVTFENAESVQHILADPGHQIHGQQLAVDLCLTKDKGGGKSGKVMPGTVATGDRLFITKVPPESTQEEIETLFSKYGQWTDLYLPAGHFPGGHKGICFISYTDPTSAQLAISCGPHQLRGQDIVVELATPRDAKGGGKGDAKGGGKSFQPPHQQYSSSWHGAPAAPVYAGQGVVVPPPGSAAMGLKPGRLFLTKVPDDVTKEDLTNYFQQYGQLEDVFVPTGKSIAFVSFVDATVAQLVVATPQHTVKFDRVVTVDLAYDRPPLETKGKGKYRYQAYY
jgi:RNA recognition motif-containing protein